MTYDQHIGRVLILTEASATTKKNLQELLTTTPKDPTLFLLPPPLLAPLKACVQEIAQHHDILWWLHKDPFSVTAQLEAARQLRTPFYFFANLTNPHTLVFLKKIYIHCNQKPLTFDVLTLEEPQEKNWAHSLALGIIGFLSKQQVKPYASCLLVTNTTLLSSCQKFTSLPFPLATQLALASTPSQRWHTWTSKNQAPYSPSCRPSSQVLPPYGSQLSHLWDLIIHLGERILLRKVSPSLLSFLSVGVVGLAFQLGLLEILFLSQRSFTILYPLSTLLTILFNYQLNNALTFRSQSHQGWRAWWQGALSFYGVCALGGCLNILVTIALHQYFSVPSRIAPLGGVVLGSFSNFALAKLLTWRTSSQPSKPLGSLSD